MDSKFQQRICTSPRTNAVYKKIGFENQGIINGDGGQRVAYIKKITHK